MIGKSPDPFVSLMIKDLQGRGYDRGPYFCVMPCGKKIWFDEHARFHSTTQAPCVKLAFPGRYLKSALVMTQGGYKRSLARAIKRADRLQ